MGLLEFATENEKSECKIRGCFAKIARSWLKMRADHQEKRLARRQISVPEDHGDVWERIQEEVTQVKN